jgi:GT2 family glycosyltransferase
LNANLRSVSNPAAVRSLEQIRHALKVDALDAALCHVDRAWRSLPDEAERLAPIYGRLLALEVRDHEATLRLLLRAIEFAPDPEVAALIALAQLRLRRPEEAQGSLGAALAHYCVEPGGLLFHVAGIFLQHPSISVRGWIGRGPSLEFVGELSSSEPANVLEIRLDGKPGFAQPLRNTARTSRRSFRFQPPGIELDATVEVSSSGVALLGSGARIPADFSIDGRSTSRGRIIRGWARLGWRPARPLRLRIEDENGRCVTARTLRVPQPGWRWPFQISLRAAGLRGSRIRISAQRPDGRWEPLPDSPLLLESAVRLPRQRGIFAARARAKPAVKRAPRTDIIIPVYRGREETLACIESVLSTIDAQAQVLVVDDATEDRALQSALERMAGAGRITVLRNAENKGFAASVNLALSLHPAHDAVLLNSDTRVFGDWLDRLREAAYSEPHVGTVTPLTNSGSIASYPSPLGTSIDPAAGAALHALAGATHAGTRVEIPVGVGFCLYLRRDCLREVGDFDASLFDKGYGEETDFCLRALRRGWSHRLAVDVFVSHAGGLSFGPRRTALLDRAHRLINLRHPGYDRFISRFLAQAALPTLRRRLDERRLTAFDGRFVLIVTLALSGGVDRFVAGRCRDLRAEGYSPLVLRPAEAGSARRCELWTDALEVPNLRYDIPAELPAVTALLRALPLAGVEIQHFLHLDARLIEAVRALPLPYDVYVHDFAWICPRVTLIDGSGRYCGEPEVGICKVCVRRNGSHLGEAISVPALRSRSETWLKGARRVFAPTRDAAARLQSHFADLAVEVRPHSAPVTPAPLPPRASADKRIRVALIGAIGGHKGYRVLLACARDARARRLPIDFVVIGYTDDDAPLLKTGKVSITGRYTEAEVPHLLRHERPDVAWFPSVSPETWCYTLDHALAMGLSVLAFDLGAIAERLRAAGVGELMPLESKPASINDRLLKAGQPTSRSVQTPPLPPPGDARMGGPHLNDEPMNNKNTEPAKPVTDGALSASVQVLPLPPGLYLFSVQSAAAAVAATKDGLKLPAVHVGLGPGVRSEQVEFIAGPSTHGAWLFAKGDLLVTRINGTGATLIVSSMRAPGGDLLSIKVERLDARAEALSPAPAVAAPTPAPAKPARDSPALPIRISAHIRTRGDMSFVDVPWAGRVGSGLWIESFSVRPLERFTAKDLEYKGLTASGFETPWLSDEKMCGTKGMAVPLVGFAVRLKPSPASAAYDCEYSGYFQSGATVGPLRNGAPCRSTVANDPLEGLQIRLVKRTTASEPALRAAAATAPAPPAKSAAPARHKSGGRARSTRRLSDRRR